MKHGFAFSKTVLNGYIDSHSPSLQWVSGNQGKRPSPSSICLHRKPIVADLQDVKNFPVSGNIHSLYYSLLLFKKSFSFKKVIFNIN